MRIDIWYCQNNGVIAIKPGQGRTAKLMRFIRTNQGNHHDMVWVFADPIAWKDEAGNQRIDHRQRGVMCGTYEEGGGFLGMCRRLGLSVMHMSFFVPFSNGQRRYGTYDDGQPFSDYTEHELQLARYDLPTEDELHTLLAAEAGESAASNT